MYKNAFLLHLFHSPSLFRVIFFVVLVYVCLGYSELALFFTCDMFLICCLILFCKVV